MLSRPVRSSKFKRAASSVVIVVASVLVVGVGCGDDDTSGGGGSGGTSGATGGTGDKGGLGGSGGGSAAMCPADAGGPVTPPDGPDMHCIDDKGNEIKQVTNESACKLPADAGEPDAGVEEEAPVLYGSEGDDDDCKYHLKWTASCVTENRDVTFKLTVTKRADGKPLTGADPDLEVYLSDTHLAPNTVQKPVETSPGVYTAGPIRFDAPGRWTVRFHLREECVDLTEDSPHGHAAFFVDVP